MWEDREAQKGRKIGLKFVVIPATGQAKATEAVAFFSGGPGQAAIDSLGWVTGDLKSLRDTRDNLKLWQGLLAQTVAEVRAWRPVLGPGAVIVFDDYTHPDFPGVGEAVAELGLSGDQRGTLFVHHVPGGDRTA